MKKNNPNQVLVLPLLYTEVKYFHNTYSLLAPLIQIAQLIWGGKTLNVLQTLHSLLCYICIAIHQPNFLFQEKQIHW